MHTPNTLNIVVFFIYQGLFKTRATRPLAIQFNIHPRPPLPFEFVG